MSNNANIQTMLETARRVFEAADAVVAKLPDGTRMQIKDLAHEVGTAVSMEPKNVLGFVNHFVHNNEGVSFVTRGKNGGIVKGTKPVKVVKVSKKVAKAPAADDSDTSNS